MYKQGDSNVYNHGTYIIPSTCCNNESVVLHIQIMSRAPARESKALTTFRHDIFSILKLTANMAVHIGDDSRITEKFTAFVYLRACVENDMHANSAALAQHSCGHSLFSLRYPQYSQSKRYVA